MTQMARVTTWASLQVLTASTLNGEFNNVINTWNNHDSGSSAWTAISSGAGTFSGSVTVTPTSNQLVLGTTRTVTITAPTPASSSRTHTIPDVSASASFVMTEGTQTVNGTKTFAGQLIGKGTAAVSDAAAGYIGEYIASVISTYGNAGTSTEFANVTSISLTAGDWDVTGQVQFYRNGATVTVHKGVVSTSSGNTTTDHIEGSNLMFTLPTTDNTGQTAITIANYRINVASTTTVYLKAATTYSAGTPQQIGTLRARRVR